VKAEGIAQKATRLVSGDRKAAYGDVMDGLAKIAVLWNALLTAAGKAPARPLDEHDVGQMMVNLKQARSYTGPHRADNHVDQAGWSSVAGEAAERLSRRRP
jgi:hypothetical protein